MDQDTVGIYLCKAGECSIYNIRMQTDNRNPALHVRAGFVVTFYLPAIPK